MPNSHPTLRALRGCADAGVALYVGPVAAQEKEVVEHEGDDEHPGVVARYGLEKSLRNLCEESLGSADFYQRERNDGDDGGEQNEKLQHVGHHDGAQAADRDVKDAESPQQQDARVERNVGRDFDDLGDGVEECTGRKERDEEEQIGVHLLRRYAEAAGDVFGGRETAGAVPARGDEESDGEARGGHRELNGHRHPSVGIGDRAPDDERAGREEAHEQRKAADPPGNVTPPAKKLFIFLPVEEKETPASITPAANSRMVT